MYRLCLPFGKHKLYVQPCHTELTYSTCNCHYNVADVLLSSPTIPTCWGLDPAMASFQLREGTHHFKHSGVGTYEVNNKVANLQINRIQVNQKLYFSMYYQYHVILPYFFPSALAKVAFSSPSFPVPTHSSIFFFDYLKKSLTTSQASGQSGF